jgi:hypothetical protein
MSHMSPTWYLGHVSWWIEYLAGVGSEVAECSILSVIIIKIACEFSRVALS